MNTSKKQPNVQPSGNDKYEVVAVNLNGKWRKPTKAHAVLMRKINEALKGDK